MNTKISRREFNLTLAAGTLGLMAGCSINNKFDIVIKNGLIIDGSGGPAYKKDIGIIGNTIVAIDDLKSSTADMMIDGEGLVVSPDFIDIHTHTDIQLLVNSKAESKIHQGVTTEVSGNCGDSPFPIRDEDFQDYDERIFEEYGIHIDWRDTDGYLRSLENHKISINHATLTGQGTLRSIVVGNNDVQANPEQIKEMKDLLERSMAEGSFGLSSGLEYAPGSYASTEELIALNEVVAKNGGIYATHMRSEDDHVEEAVQEALRICKEAEVSTQIAHLKACNQGNWHKIDHVLEMINDAAVSGMQITADRYPYIAYSTGLTMFLPLWSRQGSTEEILARLTDSKTAKKIEDHAESKGRDIGGWDRVVISSCDLKKNKIWEGKSVQACAQELNKTPFEFMRDILIEENNRVSMIGFAMDENNLKKVLSSAHVMIGSDGNAVAPSGKLSEGKPHPRFYGTFPRVLGKYTREDNVFDLATAVNKMTRMPATKLGLDKRGLIAKDYYADIVLFNPETVIDNASFTDPHQFPSGIEYVIVNGKVTVENGKHTGAQAGSVLRHTSA
ncbi:MAG: D-aminoacylase [Bacteroidales bacterium]|nr:D-aminoacylase [Bacteroidales bacterium]